MQILPVVTAADARVFLEVPLAIYKTDPNWIRPLDKDVQEVFDKKKNKAFRFGKVQRWILKDNQEKAVGRVAAFINNKYKNKGDDVKVGGIGFFECTDNEQYASLLFDTAKEWLMQENVEAMDGPINFGERDRWWGLVTEGFHPPLYCMNYNLPYYQKLFEDYGFRLFFNQVCFGMKAQVPLDKRIWERHAALAVDAGYSSKIIRKDQLLKFAEDFATVYNKAWGGHGGMKELNVAQVMLMFKKMKPVMDEKLVLFAYYKEAPIAIFINLPDLNQWFKKLNGKFDLIHKLYFLWLKTFQRNAKFTGIVFGVVPEFQGRGVDAYIIAEAAKILQTPDSEYEEYEMQWIGDFNPKMINIAESLGHVSRTRNLVTYRYFFDRTKEFKRHPFLV